MSKNAAFAIALATEMFIQHLATTTHNVVKAERKPRRNIQYRDVSSAIAKTDNLEFLVDVVPKTTTYKDFKKKQDEKEKAKKETAAAAGQNGEASGKKQTTLDVPTTNGNTAVETPQNGTSSPPLPEKVVETPNETPDAMDVDETPVPVEERVEDSEPEEDAAAMQIEMEMRGPPRPTQSVSPQVRRTSGFTAINGSK